MMRWPRGSASGWRLWPPPSSCSPWALCCCAAAGCSPCGTSTTAPPPPSWRCRISACSPRPSWSCAGSSSALSPTPPTPARSRLPTRRPPIWSQQSPTVPAPHRRPSLASTPFPSTSRP